MVQDKATKAPKLTCRNWECGVVIPISGPVDINEDEMGNPPDAEGLAWLNRVVPVPMRYPGDSFEGTTKTPWTSSSFD